MGKTLTDEQMVRVLKHLNFKELAKTEAEYAAGQTKKSEFMNEGGSFFRKGTAPFF